MKISRFIAKCFLLLFCLTGCDMKNGYFPTYKEFYGSSFYKGGWIPEFILLESSSNIHISNNLDTNKVWFVCDIKQSDPGLVSLMVQNSNDSIKNEARSQFIRNTKQLNVKSECWHTCSPLFFKIGNNQYYAIDTVRCQLYYLALGY